ncbi:glycerol-3-phosphate acyltransferase PlsX [Mycoplasmopsis californica]|uniref:Phosphate acyltransferase n=1 Tax=Mycoplasmopsis equigenitalium TaxID=114883 RepID=A0ABY5J406_9BACT|nr:phosphate acyltransferase PlsX [Mycoplasmopsis equigenitalium]UUD36877.1 phosphate acyltransferase PlsX [Mycoplasmopsis equigenitalium]VEU69828.1 glycerol-3-phosphate acyltransferase PlsX [Mycoplasmopsis californica]
MYKIAFDIMGNDKGLEPAIAASIEFATQNENYTIWLVGDGDEIAKYYNGNLKNIKIIDSKNTIKFSKNIREEMAKPSSMMDAIQLTASGKVDAVVSCGDSGMFLVACSLILKRLKGVSRAAFMPIMPTVIKNKKFLLLDTGANVETKPNFLVEWAKIARIFYKYMFNISNPIIKQINIGTEEYKGGELQHEANDLLFKENINYQGYIEPRDLLLGNCDIVVTDGFSGNLVLKSMEGTVLNFKKIIKDAITKTFLRKLAAVTLKKAFSEVAEDLDYRNVGAAWVMGVNHMAIKTHGSSDRKAFLGALNQVKLGLDNNIFNKIKEEFK